MHFEFCFVGRHILASSWMSEFHVICGELVLILLVAIKEWTGVVLKEIEQLGSGLVQEMKVNECSEKKVLWDLLNREGSNWISNVAC